MGSTLERLRAYAVIVLDSFAHRGGQVPVGIDLISVPRGIRGGLLIPRLPEEPQWLAEQYPFRLGSLHG